jgi:hypothetical protein
LRDGSIKGPDRACPYRWAQLPCWGRWAQCHIFTNLGFPSLAIPTTPLRSSLPLRPSWGVGCVWGYSPGCWKLEPSVCQAPEVAQRESVSTGLAASQRQLP